jgi:hypothetical protein
MLGQSDLSAQFGNISHLAPFDRKGTAILFRLRLLLFSYVVYVFFVLILISTNRGWVGWFYILFYFFFIEDIPLCFDMIWYIC